MSFSIGQQSSNSQPLLPYMVVISRYKNALEENTENRDPKVVSCQHWPNNSFNQAGSRQDSTFLGILLE